MPELRKGIFLKGGQHPGRGVSLAGIYSEGYLATSLAFEEWFVSSVPIWKLK